MGILFSVVCVGLFVALLGFSIDSPRPFDVSFGILDFLKAFGLFSVHTGLAALIAGGIGATLARLIQWSDKLAEPATRVLRLGHWLPFFVLWALPGWKAPWVSRSADVTACGTFLETV